jgi:hypothetical protein
MISAAKYHISTDLSGIVIAASNINVSAVLKEIGMKEGQYF